VGDSVNSLDDKYCEQYDRQQTQKEDDGAGHHFLDIVTLM
jgi:hypothetical protein